MGLEFEKIASLKKGSDWNVDGILNGLCHVQSKLDGTNGTVWLNSAGKVCAGSRNRHLKKLGKNDNQGFLAHVTQSDYAPKYKAFLNAHPDCRLAGEWLKKHTFKGYRDDAWDNFYVFDVLRYEDGKLVGYIHYDVYKVWLEEFGIEYVPTAYTVENPTEEFLHNNRHQANFLLKDGVEIGEGYVVKRYDFMSVRTGTTTWKKYVNAEFGDSHKKAMGAPKLEMPHQIEQKIIDKLLTPGLIAKERDRIVAANGGWERKLIGKVFGETWQAFIEDEIHGIIRTAGKFSVNFKRLNALLIQKIKAQYAEDF